MDIAIEATPEAAARRLAARITVLARLAMAKRGSCSLALSGGSTGTLLLEALVDTEIAWGRVDVYQVDERVAPDGDPDRNATVLLSRFVERVGLPESRLHLMDVTAGDLEGAARRYAAALPAALDVVHLGLGDDGHTASWPPGDPVVERTDAVAVVGPFNGHQRLTLTLPVVNGAGERVLLVTGAAKAPVLQALRRGDRSLPAAHVTTTGTLLACDRAAARPA